MKTKIIIDSEAAREHYFNTTGVKMTQKELAKKIETSEPNLDNLKNKAPKAFKVLMNIQKETGAPLDVLIKEVPEK